MKSESKFKYILFFHPKKYVFENDRKLSTISVLTSMCSTYSKWWNLEYDCNWTWTWKYWNLEYDCTDIILFMCATEFMLVLPMAQPDLLVVSLYIFSFPIPPTNLCCHKRGYYCVTYAYRYPSPWYPWSIWIPWTMQSFACITPHCSMWHTRMAQLLGRSCHWYTVMMLS